MDDGARVLYAREKETMVFRVVHMRGVRRGFQILNSTCIWAGMGQGFWAWAYH